MPTPQDYQRFGIDPRTKVGGQKLNAPIADPTAAMKYMDPVEMLLGVPWSNTEPLPDANQILSGVAGAMMPAHLRPDYELPDTGSKITDAMVGLGQVFQGGSGTEGVLGGGGALLAQALGELPAADSAMGMFLPAHKLTHVPAEKLPEFSERGAASVKLSDRDYLDEIRSLFKDTGFSLPTAEMSPLYHVSDQGAELTPEAIALLDARGVAAGVPLPDVVKHPELYDRMPALRNTTVDLSSVQQQFGPAFFEPRYNRINVARGNADTLEDIMSTLLHETSHDVDFLTGRGEPGMFTNVGYNRYALAKEAAPEAPPPRGHVPELQYPAENLYLRNRSETLARLVEQMRILPRGTTLRQQHMQDYYGPRTGIKPYGNIAKQRLLRNVGTPEEFVSVPQDQQIIKHSPEPSADFGLTEEDRQEFLANIRAALSQSLTNK